MDTYDFLADPRALTMEERFAARERMHAAQQRWLSRIRDLAEDPQPEDDFPAFLLETRPFHELARALNGAARAKDLSTEDADQLAWFIRAFADYMRTRDGEEVFPALHRLTG